MVSFRPPAAGKHAEPGQARQASSARFTDPHRGSSHSRCALAESPDGALVRDRGPLGLARPDTDFASMAFEQLAAFLFGPTLDHVGRRDQTRKQH